MDSLGKRMPSVVSTPSTPVTPSVINNYLGISSGQVLLGTFAARPSFASLPAGTFYYATDQSTVYVNLGTAWNTSTRRILIGGFDAIFAHANTSNRTYTLADADGNLVYETAALTDHAIVLGNAGAKVKAGTLGTTTTVLHGNASGDPTYAAVSLAADVSGVLPLANGGAAGATGSVTLFGPSTDGSLTFANGLITAFVAPT